MKTHTCIVLIVSAVGATCAIAAGTIGTASAPPASAPIRMIAPLNEVKGVLSWDVLAKVKSVPSKDRILPNFSKEVTALNDTEVKIQGFMMPLDPGEKQKHFLLSVNPVTCAFCMPAGPEGVVEVKSTMPVKYSFEPIVVVGKMAVLKNDPMGLFYRLTNASLISVK
jgi:hypothetical protein